MAKAGEKSATTLSETAPAPRVRDESLVVRLLRGLREGGTAQTLLAALVAWAITLAPAAWVRSSSVLSTLLAALALIAGLSGPLLVSTYPQLARHVGITAFLGFATATWLVSSPAVQPGRLDPTRAVIGAIAWGVYALTWRERWQTPDAEPPADIATPILQARLTVPALSRLIATIGIGIGLGYLVLAWRTRDPDRALATQAVAVACATAVITTSATVALSRGKRQSGGARRLTAVAVRSLILLLLFIAAGVLAIILR